MKDAGEKAMALVDGQLAPAEVPDLVQELARNPSLVTELQTYLALSRSRVAGVFAAKGEEPVPAWLTDIVLRGGGTAGRQPAPHEGFGRRLLRWLQGSYRVPAWSLAAAPAAVVLLAALAGGLALLHADRGTDRSGQMEASLGAALEGTASGTDAALASVRPVLSFSSTTAGWCRQIEVRHATRQVSHALACRGEDGKWNVLSSTAPGTAPGPAGFAPAGTDRRKAIDDLATSMMRSSPLSPEEEAALIARRWRPQ
jgi:hypothetical protein